jgi:hypothetical protein
MFRRLKQYLGIIPRDQVDEVFRLADEAAQGAVRQVDKIVVPARNTLLTRFPVLFSLLVTTGAAAIILGIEQLILKYNIFTNHPELIFISGVAILAFTGRLYKKLSNEI